MTRLLRRLAALWCRLHGGHYPIFQTEPDRLRLRCMHCGHSTPGWDVARAR